MAKDNEISILLRIDGKDANAQIKITDENVNALYKSFRMGNKDASDATKSMVQGFTVARDVIGGMKEAYSAFASVFGSTIKKAQDYEMSMAQLKGIIASNGSAAGYTAEQMDLMAASFAKGSMFTKGNVLEAEKMFMTYKNIGHDVMPKAVEAAIGMAEVMGGDLSSAAVTLGQVLENPIEGARKLRAMHIVLTQAQKDELRQMQETQGVQAAGGYILNILAEKYGMVSDAIKDTQEFKVKQMNDAMGKMFKTVGEGQMAVIAPFITSLSDMLGWLNKMSPVIGASVVGAGQLLVAYKLLSTAGIMPMIINTKAAGDAMKMAGTWFVQGAKSGEVMLGATEGLKTGLSGLVKSIGPLGWVMIALTGLTAAYSFMKGAVDETDKAIKDVNLETSKGVGVFKAYASSVLDSNNSMEARKNALTRMQELDPEHTRNINLEKLSYKDLTTAIGNANAQYEKQMKLKGYSKQYEKVAEKIAELEVEKNVALDALDPLRKAYYAATTEAEKSLYQNQMQVITDQYQIQIDFYSEKAKAILTLINSNTVTAIVNSSAKGTLGEKIETLKALIADLVVEKNALADTDKAGQDAIQKKIDFNTKLLEEKEGKNKGSKSREGLGGIASLNREMNADNLDWDAQIQQLAAFRKEVNENTKDYPNTKEGNDHRAKVLDEITIKEKKVWADIAKAYLESEKLKAEAMADGVEKDMALADVWEKEQIAKIDESVKDEKIAADQKVLIHQQYLGKITDINGKKAKKDAEDLAKAKELALQNAKDAAAFDKSLARGGVGNTEGAMSKAEVVQQTDVVDETAKKDKATNLKLLNDKAIDNAKYESNEVMIHANATAAKAAIDDAALNSRLAATSTMLSNSKALFGKHTVAYKALATAQVIVDTYSSATAAYRSMVGIPVVGPALAAVAAAAAVAMGIKNLSAIYAAKVSGYALGGVIDRPTYALMGEAGPEIVAPKDTFIQHSAELVRAAINSAGYAGGSSQSKMMSNLQNEVSNLKNSFERYADKATNILIGDNECIKIKNRANTSLGFSKI